MAGMILPVLEITSYSETPSFAVTVLPSMVNSIVAASTSGFVAGFNPMVPQSMINAKHPSSLNEPSCSPFGIPTVTGLAVALSHDDVIGSEQGNRVGNHIASRHVVKRAHMNEGRSSDLESIRFSTTRADDVKAQFPFMRFRSTVDLSRRSIEALRKELELLDHRFQVRKH